ncbi:MAG: PIN domain-containing protein, partial [Bacteroidota bacterium]
MQLIVDTNILASALIRNAITRQILLSPSFNLFLPEFSLEELRENWDFILRKSKLPESELEQLLLLLLRNVTVVPESSYAQFIPGAQEIMAAIDIDDAPFLALALSFHNDGIWSNDKDFERQSVV